MTKRLKGTLFLLSWVVVLSFLFFGCVLSTKKTGVVSEVRSIFGGTFKVDPYMEKHPPRSVAIVPFVDQSGSREGFEIVRKCFYNHLSSLPFRDMELSRVNHLLQKAGLTDPEEIRKKGARELGKILSVDAVVFGTISNFDKLFAVIYSQVSVGAQIEMYDTKTGNFLWSGEHTVRSHSGGISTTPVGIIATIVATAMNVRDIQLLRACDDLFRDMVKTIPTPKLAEVAQPPVITFLAQDTKGLPKKAGDEVKVVMKGSPGLRAWFGIGDYRKGIDMKEVEEGGYLGVYRVVPGDNVAGAVVTGFLSDDSGNTSQWIDAIGTVTLDTTPPAVPSGFNAVGRNTYVLLDWVKNTDKDLAGYRVYRSVTPLSGYEEIGKTEFNELKDKNLENLRKYFYRLSAEDVAGNESGKTDSVEGMPMPPGPTAVSGTIEADTTWYSGASPYVLEGPVVVKDRALLTVEPGTVIRSKGAALVIEGRLVARGDEKRLIHFEGSGGWPGIHFANVREKDNVLRYCRIRGAETGIRCEASSPKIESVEITGNAVGLRIEGSFSRPEIRNCTIHKNKTAGIVVDSSARPAVRENRIEGNGGPGIEIRNADALVEGNVLSRNGGSGIALHEARLTAAKNSFCENRPYDLAGETGGDTAKAQGNWWGTTDVLQILSKIRGRVDIRTVLDGPPPEGKPKSVNVQPSTLEGTVLADGYLLLSGSPFRVVSDFVIDGGATLFVEPGVEIQYDQKTAILVRDGGIHAKGTGESPIVFTASAASPSAGFYGSAVRFSGASKVNSFLEFCVARYASTAFDIHGGAPEITSCYIADNAQSGIACRNDASPKITYCTFQRNSGEGAITAVGMSNPFIGRNNFSDNAVAVQSFSSIYIDARNNWWGESPPNRDRIWGTSINIEPWLTSPESRAFAP
ncbi:MAG TPA: DUF799 family lipoprotein [Syntrophales bacterium]|nr:DUF799 family lipoprotein [Syntrophales bacterium]